MALQLNSSRSQRTPVAVEASMRAPICAPQPCVSATRPRFSPTPDAAGAGLGATTGFVTAGSSAGVVGVEPPLPEPLPPLAGAFAAALVVVLAVVDPFFFAAGAQRLT